MAIMSSASGTVSEHPSDRKKGLRLAELKGHWALITGASSGIGREFAIELAAAGMNLALVARREEPLQVLADELTSRHGIRTLALPADLAEQGVAKRLHARLLTEGIRVRLLVNNAAVGRWAPFEASSSEFYEEMIRTNAAAPVSLCREFLPDLASHSSSAVINVSSPAAYQPVPYMAAYAATKAFMHSFSLALHEEWREKGVQVQTLLPGPTVTQLEGAQAGVKGGGTAAEAVSVSLANLGSPVVTSAHGTHWQRLFALLPARLVLRQVARMFRPHH